MGRQTPTVKRCTVCKKPKALDDFSLVYRNDCDKNYRMSICKMCRSKKQIAIYWENPVLARAKALKNRTPDKMKDWNLRFNYGITLSDWKQILKKQKNRCAICGRKKPTAKGWQTDHKGPKVRGILCAYCNIGLGLAQDSIKILKKMISYLEKHDG